LYLLRVGYAGTMGALTDIDQQGFPSAAFHAFPDMLRDDPITGDYGPNFFGHAWNTATYVVNDPTFGWQAFGGNIRAANGSINITPLDSARTRVYLAPLGLWLTLDAGTFDKVELNPTTKTVRISLPPSDQFTPAARLRIEQPAKLTNTGSYSPTQKLRKERDAYVIPLSTRPTWVELKSSTSP
jgi:hypothetical protein